MYTTSAKRYATYEMRQGLDDDQEMMYVVTIYIHLT